MASVPVTRKDSIVDQLEQVHQQIARRAHELFRNSGALWGDHIADWFNAEQEVLWKPAVEMLEKDGTLTVSAALAGVDPKDVKVDITAEDLVIKGETEHTHSKDHGQVHQCEFTSGQIFRSVHFPKPVDVGKAKAEYRNGLLTVTVPVAAEAQARTLEIKAA